MKTCEELLKEIQAELNINTKPVFEMAVKHEQEFELFDDLAESFSLIFEGRD